MGSQELLIEKLQQGSDEAQIVALKEKMGNQRLLFEKLRRGSNEEATNTLALLRLCDDSDNFIEMLQADRLAAER